MADADHLIGFLALTVISLAAAEVARPLRYCLVPLGGALMVTPFLFGASGIHRATSVAIGLLLVALSFRRGKLRAHYDVGRASCRERGCQDGELSVVAVTIK